MKNRYCIGSKLPEPAFRALVRAYFSGKTTEDAARSAKVSQGTVKNLYRRITYRLIDDFAVFEFHRALLSDCFSSGGERVETLKRCLWRCPGDKGFDLAAERNHCPGCQFAAQFQHFPDEDRAVLVMYSARRSLAPLSAFGFVNRAAYIFAQEYTIYGPPDHRRRQASRFIAALKGRPLGSAGSKEQIADRYVKKIGIKPHWYVTGQGDAYHLPDHDMM